MGYYVPAGYSRINFNFAPVWGGGSSPTFGFGVNRPPSSVLVNDYYDMWTVVLQPLVNSGVTLNSITARNNVGYAERLVGQNGARTSESQPPQVAALIRLSTGLIGRANRGRIYVPFVLPDSAVGGAGDIDPGWMDELESISDAIASYGDDSGAELQILHSTERAPTPVTSRSVSNQVATQRRRNRR